MLSFFIFILSHISIYAHVFHFIEFIRPVCLPVEGDHKFMTGKKSLTLTGWGFIDAGRSKCRNK